MTDIDSVNHTADEQGTPADLLMPAGSCPNCDGRRCMGCVVREVHDECLDDCPTCCITEVRERVRARTAELRERVTDTLAHWRIGAESVGLDDAREMADAVIATLFGDGR